jgi:hypothetical protein
MYCTLVGSKGGRQRGKKVRKHRTYSGARCRIVEHWFPVNGNCFVKNIFTRRINYESTKTTLYVKKYTHRIMLLRLQTTVSKNKVTFSNFFLNLTVVLGEVIHLLQKCLNFLKMNYCLVD